MINLPSIEQCGLAGHLEYNKPMGQPRCLASKRIKVRACKSPMNINVYYPLGIIQFIKVQDQNYSHRKLEKMPIT